MSDDRSMENSSFIDILILAMIAAFVVFRLRSALGRRTGHQRPPDKFPRDVEDSGDSVIHLPDRNADADAQRKDGADQPPPLSRPAESGSPSSGMTQLKIADPSFDETQFLDGARIAFEMILQAFADGNKDQLGTLLADDVLERFSGEIERREHAGESLETTLVSFASADILSARLDDGLATVDVKFVTDQIKLLRSEQGVVIEGDEARTSRTIDIWAFERDLRSDDPNWRLVETRSGD